MKCVDNVKAKNHRLHALCPYFAMFPPSFAKETIIDTTEPGDVVLDPFSGRGTTLLEALLNGRKALASDINPVAATISGAKATPPKLDALLDRILEREHEFKKADQKALSREADLLPEFFSVAFHRSTLLQVLFMRGKCRNIASAEDRFIAALCLGHLHGESNKSQNFFSNQMAHTIAMKPAYAVRYWKEKGIVAPERDVFDILRRKASFRFEDGMPKGKAIVARGDAREAAKHFQNYKGRVSSVITSPPYLDVTNFEEDQWLRLWFLGGKPWPTYGEVSNDDRHNSADSYFAFLADVWKGIAPLLKKSATITCRISSKKIGEGELAEKLCKSISSVWPKARQMFVRTSGLQNRQTEVFRPGSEGCGNEYDFRFTLV